MLKLTLQSFGHLMRTGGSLEKTLMLGRIEGKRKRGQQRIRWWDSIINSMVMNLSKLQEIVEGGWVCATVHGVTKSWTWLSKQLKNAHVEALIPNMIVLGEGAFMTVIKVKWGHEGGALIQQNWSPYKKRGRHQMFLSFCTQTQRKGHMSEKCHLQAKERKLTPEPNILIFGF